MLQERNVAIFFEMLRSRRENAIPSAEPPLVFLFFSSSSYRPALCFAGTSIPLFPARPGQLSLGVASTPLNPRGHALEKSRPLSRVLSWTVIPLGCASPRSSSDLPGSLTWATWCGRHAPRASLFGLAPGGVCRATDVATRAVRSYRTISPLPAPLVRHLGGIFLLHFP